MPSGGLLVRARYAWRRRLWAVEDAMMMNRCTYGLVGREGKGSVVVVVVVSDSYFSGCPLAAVGVSGIAYIFT